MFKSLKRQVSNTSYRQLLLEFSEELSSNFASPFKKKQLDKKKGGASSKIGSKRSWAPNAAPVLNDYNAKDDCSLSVAEYEAILCTPPQKPKRRASLYDHIEGPVATDSNGGNRSRMQPPPAFISTAITNGDDDRTTVTEATSVVTDYSSFVTLSTSGSPIATAGKPRTRMSPKQRLASRHRGRQESQHRLQLQELEEEDKPKKGNNNNKKKKKKSRKSKKTKKEKKAKKNKKQSFSKSILKPPSGICANHHKDDTPTPTTASSSSSTKPTVTKQRRLGKLRIPLPFVGTRNISDGTQSVVPPLKKRGQNAKQAHTSTNDNNACRIDMAGNTISLDNGGDEQSVVSVSSKILFPRRLCFWKK